MTRQSSQVTKKYLMSLGGNTQTSPNAGPKVTKSYLMNLGNNSTGQPQSNSNKSVPAMQEIHHILNMPVNPAISKPIEELKNIAVNSPELLAKLGGAGAEKLGQDFSSLLPDSIQKHLPWTGVSANKLVGLPQSPGWETASDVASGLIPGGAVSKGSKLLGIALKDAPKAVKYIAASLAPAAGTGAFLDPHNRVEGALFGSLGKGAESTVSSLAGLAKKPLNAILEKMSPSENIVKAKYKDIMGLLSGAKNANDSVANSGYNNLKKVNDLMTRKMGDPREQEMNSYFGKLSKNVNPKELYEGGLLKHLKSNYPDLFDDVDERSDIKDTKSNWRPEWLEDFKSLVPKSSQAHVKFDRFIKNPTVENGINFKKSLNSEYDSKIPGKNSMLREGKDVIENSFLKPTIQKYDNEMGTNFWKHYKLADEAHGRKFDEFGEKTPLGALTSGGGRFRPKDYKEAHDLMDKYIKSKDAGEESGPLMSARDKLSDAILEHDNRVSSAKEMGKLSKLGLGIGKLGASSISNPLSILNKAGRAAPALGRIGAATRSKNK